jgi:hypothetical protein
MFSIRSLLWVGSGEALARSGIADSPRVDITWVPDAVVCHYSAHDHAALRS